MEVPTADTLCYALKQNEAVGTNGTRICGFYSEEIDKLIDKEEEHDAGRYDVEVFLKQIEYVQRNYGMKGVEYYLLHHLLDRLKDELVSMATRHKGSIDIKDVEAVLKSLKIDPLYNVSEYEPLWEELKSKVRPFLRELVEDIVSEESFRRSYRRSQVNSYVSRLVDYFIGILPPCIKRKDPKINILRLYAQSYAMGSVWEYIRSLNGRPIDLNRLQLIVEESVAKAVKEECFYDIESCTHSCKPEYIDETSWRKFLRKLNVPCMRNHKTKSS